MNEQAWKVESFVENWSLRSLAFYVENSRLFFARIGREESLGAQCCSRNLVALEFGESRQLARIEVMISKSEIRSSKLRIPAVPVKMGNLEIIFPRDGEFEAEAEVDLKANLLRVKLQSTEPRFIVCAGDSVMLLVDKFDRLNQIWLRNIIFDTGLENAKILAKIYGSSLF